MLADLKILEDKLYQPETLEWFCQKYSIHEVIKQLNKSTKKESRQRMKYFFSKISQSAHYKEYLLSCLTEENEKKKEFIKYVSSQHSEQFFTLLQNKKDDVLHIIENNQAIVPVLMKLVGFEYGIKLIKLFKQMYEQDSPKYDCLFHPLISNGLMEGLGFEEGSSSIREDVDTVAQMRYMEIIVSIAILGGKCYSFVGQILNKALSLYNTNDILLKMALVQIISVLGQGNETSKLLRQHKIWKMIQKDACDPDQEFYVKKFLFILLIDMSTNGQYQMSPKLVKDLQQYLKINISGVGQYLEAAIDTITHLFKTQDGVKIVVQNSQIFNRYIKLSTLTLDNIKKPFYDSLVSLTYTGGESLKQAKQSPKYKLVINILNCIGNPSLATEVTQNFHSNTYMMSGIESFCRWFSSLLQMPFEDVEMKLLDIFLNLLNFYEVIESLLQNKDTTKYLLRHVAPNDSNKVLRNRKNELINKIIHKGGDDWKDKELSEYSKSLEQLMKGKKEEAVYAMDVL